MVGAEAGTRELAGAVHGSITEVTEDTEEAGDEVSAKEAGRVGPKSLPFVVGCIIDVVL